MRCSRQLETPPVQCDNPTVGARILWKDQQGNEGEVELREDTIQIGRALDCQIRTDDAMVSRYHAKITWGKSGYVLEDMGSANGMFFNELRVAQHRLNHGDAVRCGSLWIRFVSPPSESKRAPTAPQRPSNTPKPPAGKKGTLILEGAGRSKPKPTLPVPKDHKSTQNPFTGPPPISIASKNGGAGPPPPAPPLDHKQTKLAEENKDTRPRPGGDEAFLRRRVEQLQTELKELRRSRGAVDGANKISELEELNAALTQEREDLLEKVQTLENQLAEEGKQGSTQKARAIIKDVSESIAELNDVLSNLRINVTAAEGEFSQFPDSLPRASYELILQALRSATSDIDESRVLLRKLRENSQ